MKGKSVAFFVDGMTFETPQQMQMPGQGRRRRSGARTTRGLDDLLAHYGFKIGDDVILEPQKNVPGPLMVDGQLQLGNYPTFLVTDSIAKSSPMFEHVDALIVPFASSVELIKDNKAQAGLMYTQLAQSSRAVVAAEGLLPVQPDGGAEARATTRGRSRSATPPRASSSRSSRASRSPTRRARRSAAAGERVACRRTQRSRSTSRRRRGGSCSSARRTW